MCSQPSGDRYLAGNPLSLSRQRQRRAQPRITRFLEKNLWQEVKATIALIPRESAREAAHYYRVRWLFSLLYPCGLRLSEVTGNMMGGFFCRRDADGEERWWLEITGKGDKLRLIPATRELMVELNRYRRENGLAPSPLPGEATLLLLPIAGQPHALTRSAVHLTVKEVFERAGRRVEERGADQAARAQFLRAASAHWLRHSAGSNMAGSAMQWTYATSATTSSMLRSRRRACICTPRATSVTNAASTIRTARSLAGRCRTAGVPGIQRRPSRSSSVRRTFAASAARGRADHTRGGRCRALIARITALTY